jgi:hypothetical protein
MNPDDAAAVDRAGREASTAWARLAADERMQAIAYSGEGVDHSRLAGTVYARLREFQDVGREVPTLIRMGDDGVKALKQLLAEHRRREWPTFRKAGRDAWDNLAERSQPPGGPVGSIYGIPIRVDERLPPDVFAIESPPNPTRFFRLPTLPPEPPPEPVVYVPPPRRTVWRWFLDWLGASSTTEGGPRG